MKILIIAVCIFLVGCETPSSGPTQRTSAVLNATVEKVWPVIVSEVAAQYPVKVIERSSGLLATDTVTMPVGFNNRGAEIWIHPVYGGLLATWAGLRMNMQVIVTEIDHGKVSINVLCHYEAYENNVQKTWIVAQSNGSVENRLLSKIEARLGN